MWFTSVVAIKFFGMCCSNFVEIIFSWNHTNRLLLLELFNAIRERLARCPRITTTNTLLAIQSVLFCGSGTIEAETKNIAHHRNNMGTVKSRPLAQSDSLSDDGISSTTRHYHNMNGNHSAGGINGNCGFLQKHDLRYEISPQSSILSTNQYHVRQSSIRSRSQQPMPDADELDKRFAKVLVS